MLLRLSQVPNLVVSSPRAAEAVLRAHDHVFASRPPSAVLHSGSSDVAMAPYGEYWRQARKFVTAHLLSAKKVQSPTAAMEHPDAEPLTHSCRGLVLLREHFAGAYYVGNPSTGQVASLPDGTTGGAAAAYPGADYPWFGLGYDALAGRHKVVRVFCRGGRPAGCEVYDVGVSSRGYWRPAASGAKPPPCLVDEFETEGVFAQGHVHWLAASRAPSDGERRPRMDSIISFSVGDETFTSVPLPPRARRRPVALQVLDDGRLSLVSYGRSASRRETWILHQDEGAGSGKPRRRRACETATISPSPGSLQIVTGRIALRLGDLFEESLASAGRPHEDIIFSSPSAQALSLALRRLPARTLGRIKCVCRSWRAVVESDRFAVSHNEHHRCAAAAAADTATTGRATFTCFPPQEFVPLDSCLASSPVTTPPLMDARVFISKPCHGLALASCGEWSALFNPLTRRHRRFSVRSIFDYKLSCTGHGNANGCIGLGYDQSREEHVLVALACTAARCSSDAGSMECRMWRLRRHDGPKERTAVPSPPIEVSFDAPPVYLDGRMYWMCRTPSRAILAFDIGAGTFDVVPAPPAMGAGVDGGDSTAVQVVELGGVLCVVQSCRRRETVTIWSAAKDGVWTRECVMQLEQWPEFSPKTAELVIPMAVEPKDGRILLNTGRALGYYDPTNKTLETVYSLQSKLLPSDKRFFAAALWEESLVRP
ncbi:hypothetical protein ACP70R_033277 [Stipagrostis hirtigluma subsp. patula]